MLRGFILGVLLALTIGAGAVTISGLPIVTTPNSADLTVIDHGGVTSQASLSSFSSVFMDLATAQTIAGVKTFSSPPVMSGASITPGTLPTNSFNAGSIPQSSLAAFSGVAVGGALTGATTGNFSATLAANAITSTTSVTAATLNATGLAASSPICSDASKNISTTCSTINYAIIDIGLGFAPGVVSTATVYPYQQVPGYSGGVITKIRVGCNVADGGTTVLHVYDNGTDITNSPYTLAAATTSTFTLGTPFALTAGHVLHAAITTAGTGSSCGITAEGTQVLQ